MIINKNKGVLSRSYKKSPTIQNLKQKEIIRIKKHLYLIERNILIRTLNWEPMVDINK